MQVSRSTRRVRHSEEGSEDSQMAPLGISQLILVYREKEPRACNLKTAYISAPLPISS